MAGTFGQRLTSALQGVEQLAGLLSEARDLLQQQAEVTRKQVEEGTIATVVQDGIKQADDDGGRAVGGTARAGRRRNRG